MMKRLADTFLLSIDKIAFDWEESDEWYGTTRLGRLGTPKKILLDYRDFSEELGVKCHRSAVMGTALHELCHFVLDYFSCYGLCGRADCATRDERSTGHDMEWVHIAIHVECYARRHLPGLDIRLGIFDAIQEEYEKTNWLPGEQDWRTMLEFLDISAVQDLVNGTRTSWVTGLEELEDSYEAQSVHHGWKVTDLPTMLLRM